MNQNNRPTIPKRQKPQDYGLIQRKSDYEDTNLLWVEMPQLKSVDEKDSKYFEDFHRSEKETSLKHNNHKRVKIKLAAIYDDEAEIVKILSDETTIHSVQRLLSMQDERGQPCIFYALQSRSKNALKCLLSVAKNRECIIAANGESILHVATRMGDVEILKRLLVQEIVGHIVDDVERLNGRTPLHLAAIFNHVEIAKELLLHGARVDMQDKAGNTPILMAASNGHASMLEAFFQYGQQSMKNLMLTPHLYDKFYDNLLQVAVDSGDEKTVHVCLDQDPEIVRKCLQKEVNHDEGGLIHSACKNGMKACLLKIVDSMGGLDKVDLNKKDNFGFTPIHKAAMNNHVDVVKYLGSISKTLVNQTTEYSMQTALVLAAERGHIEVVEELLNLEADFGIADVSDRTVLHYAVDYPNILRTLLKRGNLVQLLINAKEKDGYTPVHNAALKGLNESLKILLEFGGDMNVFTNTSRTPLHCAVSSQCLDVVQLVLSHESALINNADSTGKTPLHTAASYGSTDVVKCLLDHGALVVSDGSMYSALHIAAHNGHLDVVELLMAVDQNIIDWKNKYGRTALIVAASTGKTDVVKFLLENGAEITKDYESFNCLDWCCIKNDKDTAMTMMLHSRWNEILVTTRHGPEGTLAKLVCKMPEVAYRVLSNCMTSQGHPDSKEYVKRYDFSCLENRFPGVHKSDSVKPMTAIKTMVNTACYSCLCHPVCCKFLKAKWMEFGWKLHILSLLLYVIFLVALNIYAFGIPSYKEARGNRSKNCIVPRLNLNETVTTDQKHASIDVYVSMVICLTFTCVNALKEIIQIIFYRHRYFLDPVNYLDCVMFVCVFIFAIPMDRDIFCKRNFQWKACSVALLLAWINLVIHLRRFASFGIYILMMRRICITLIKVLCLLFFFFMAFATAFESIMNGIPGFTSFGLSLLTTAVMTMGEFGFKETFLHYDYSDTFSWLRLALLVPFIFLMPIVLMNLLLALAIDDTSSIMRQAKLRKHIQTAKMIIDLERKRSLFPWWSRSTVILTLEEQPNQMVNFSSTMWEYLFYGPEFTSEEDITDPRDKRTANENVDQRLVVIVDMMKDMQQQMKAMKQKMDEKREGTMLRENHANEITDKDNSAKEKGNALTQFNVERKSSERNLSYSNKGSRRRRRYAFSLPRESFKQSVSQYSIASVEGAGKDVLTEQEDVQDEKDREENESDPVLLELKELHKKTPLRESNGIDKILQRFSRRVFRVKSRQSPLVD